MRTSSLAAWWSPTSALSISSPPTFYKISVPTKKTYAQFFTYFSEAAEAKVLFFFGRGQILMLHSLRQGEINNVITTNSPLVWGEVSSSSSTTTSSQ
jgi:hypothetical protein